MYQQFFLLSMYLEKIHIVSEMGVNQMIIRIETSPKEIADFISELKNRQGNEIKSIVKVDGSAICQAVQTAIRDNGAKVPG